VDLDRELQGMDEVVQKHVKEWLEGSYDDEIKSEIRRLIEHDKKGLIDAFYTSLSFGTGGLRGIIGPGPNRMNRYTVQFATQGLANYLKKAYSADIAVAIGYDTRHKSKDFALDAAKVLSGNGIRVFLFDSIRPTPLVSFACRYKGCKAALMITASHNPPEYNGYKVYWDDGGQVVPPHDKGIIEEASRIKDPSQLSIGSSFIEPIGEEVDQAYIQAIQPYKLYEESHDVRILYSSLHGTGIATVPAALKSWGFSQVEFVEKQVIPDPDFSTAPSPNPEDPKALSMGMEQMIREGQDIFIATDPDCDRLGVVVRHEGRAELLTGNQLAVVAIHALCESLSRDELKGGFFAKTIVTTELFRHIAEKHGSMVVDVLPGFKYIAEKIREVQSHKFIFGAEESYGCLLGSHVRDKDAAIASCLITSIAAKAKKDGKTLVDKLEAIYKEYGYFFEKTFSIQFEDGFEGKEAQKKLMEDLRQNSPHTLADYAVSGIRDCLKKGEDGLPLSDVLVFTLEEGSRVIVRPSGTEPKIKIYLLLHEKAKEAVAKKAKIIEEGVRRIIA